MPSETETQLLTSMDAGYLLALKGARDLVKLCSTVDEAVADLDKWIEERATEAGV